MHRHLALAAITFISSFGATAAQAAGPGVSVCGSVKVTVNGQDVVNDATCLPPK